MNITDIKRANKAAGNHWFEPATMRFFNSKVESRIYEGPGGVYFVTSERRERDMPKRYSVRVFDPSTGDIDTVGEFQEFSGLHNARATAHTLAAGK
jgi:hypothetical protein